MVNCSVAMAVLRTCVANVKNVLDLLARVFRRITLQDFEVQWNLFVQYIRPSYQLQLRKHVCYRLITVSPLSIQHTGSLFLSFSVLTNDSSNEEVSRAGIRSHDLSILSLIPLPPDLQGFLPYFCCKFFVKKFTNFFFSASNFHLLYTIRHLH